MSTSISLSYVQSSHVKEYFSSHWRVEITGSYGSCVLFLDLDRVFGRHVIVCGVVPITEPICNSVIFQTFLGARAIFELCRVPVLAVSMRMASDSRQSRHPAAWSIWYSCQCPAERIIIGQAESSIGRPHTRPGQDVWTSSWRLGVRAEPNVQASDIGLRQSGRLIILSI